MKRQSSSIEELCNGFENLLHPEKKQCLEIIPYKKKEIKQIKVYKVSDIKSPFPLWKNIFQAPNFDKKRNYTYEELCDILNKHDNYLINLYNSIQASTKFQNTNCKVDSNDIPQYNNNIK